MISTRARACAPRSLAAGARHSEPRMRAAAVAALARRASRPAFPMRRALAARATADATASSSHACCSRCRGEGATFSFSRAQKKRRRVENATHREKPEKRTECAECGGSGVVPGAPERSSEGPGVAIVGGGVGGAALALALTQRGVRTVVYERDASFEARKQGYGLTMQKYSGGVALRSLGLTLRGVGSDAHVSLDSSGRVLGLYGHSAREEASDASATDATVSEAASDEKRNVHLPRQKLRQSLLDALEPGTVKWGKRLERYEESDDGVTLMFEDGTTEEAGILVGADGIFSRVRAQKLGDEPLSYLGVLVVLGICRGVDHALCRNKVFQVVDGENRMYAMPFTASADGDGCIPPFEGVERVETADDEPGAMMWQLSFPVAESEARALAEDPVRLREEAMRRCGDWPEPVAQLLTQTREDCMAGYPAYDRDITPASTLRGEESSLVTLIGDAAHPMSPFKGQGANQALLDAVQLARCIVRTPRYLLPGQRRHGCAFPFENTHEALAEAERLMLSRARGKVEKSRAAAKYLHSQAALAEGNCVRAHAAEAAETGVREE